MIAITLDNAARPHLPLVERLVTRIGRRMIPSDLAGRIRITLPSGNRLTIDGGRSGPEAILAVKNWRVLERAMRSGGNGFAESYLCGEVDTPDLVGLIRFFAANRARFLEAGRGVFASRAVDRWRHLRRANTRLGSRRNIAAHYDLSNDFFARWLDPSMTYSSALFDRDHVTLASAQRNKYDRIIAALSLPQRADILEIGCGWGGFAARLLPGTQHAYTGITLSRAQLDYAIARPEFAEPERRAAFEYRDYRDTTGQFDAIVSIEMFEAVGEENWQNYFAILRDRLKPGGTAVVQSIVIDPAVFDRYRRKADFIQTYIFPGGMLPTLNDIERSATAAGLSVQPVKTFGQDYARTLRLWREAFEDRWGEIEPLGFDDRFRRLWRYYLAYCEAGFAEGVIDVAILRFERTR